MDNNGKRIVSAAYFMNDKNIEAIRKELEEKGVYDALVGPIKMDDINKTFSAVSLVRQTGDWFDISQTVLDGNAYLDVHFAKEKTYNSNEGFGGK